MISRFPASQFAKVLLLFLVTLFAPYGAQGQAINTSAIYRNDDIGVRGAFAPAWNIITSREQAPAPLKPNFPAGKGPNESPLFIGMHESQQVFTRLLADTFFDDLEAYAVFLAQGISGQGLEITSAKLAGDNTALELDYRHPQLGLRFRERVALLPDSQVIRMAAWAAEASWPLFGQAIEDAFADVELLNAVNARDGWQPVWEGLESRLAATDIAGIVLTRPAADADVALVCADPTASMLWRVDSPALAARGSEVYVFGSIHVGKPEFYPLADEIEALYRDADYLVFEVDPSTMEDPAVVMNMQSIGLLPPGQTLGDVVSAKVIADFRRLMGTIGLSAENFMGMQPWLVTLMLTSLQMNSLGYLPEYGLENYFLSRKPPDAKILELETIQQQIGFLQALNAETYLTYTIKSFETGTQDIENLISAWQCADKAPLSAMLFEDFEDESMTATEKADMAYLMDALYTRRNVGMADKIAAYADAAPGRYFVVVGSAHLLGAGSVLELLQQDGFTVTPVSAQRH